MSWLRLDDEFALHPKVAGLTDRAFRAHIKGMLYCARFETDGRIPRNAIRELAIRPTSAKELSEAGLWKDRNGSYLINDYLIYNPSHKELEAKRAEWKERQAKSRASRRDTSSDSHESHGVVTPRPSPSPVPSTGSKGVGLSADADSALGEPDKSEPVGRLLAALHDRDSGTEKVLRSLVRQLPKNITEERALSYVRDEVVRTGAGSGRAVRILQRIVNEKELVTPGYAP